MVIICIVVTRTAIVIIIYSHHGISSSEKRQVAQLWLTEHATAYIRKVHCAVVSTASGSVQGEVHSYSPGNNNVTEVPSAE